MSKKYAYYVGSQAERTVMSLFESKGWICIRAAGSGKHGKIDIVCMKKGKVILLDVKLRRATNHVEYPVDQIRWYIQIYEEHGVDVYLCIKLKDTKTYRLLHIKELLNEQVRPDQEYILITLSKLISKGISIVEFLNQF